MRTWIFCIPTVITLLSGTVGAQVDTSSPKATVKSLYAAVERGDQAAITQLFVVENDSQGELAKAYANLILAGKRLGDAAKQKFPSATNNALLQATISLEDAAKVDKAQVSVDGDNATLKTSGGNPFSLRRVNGAWRVAIGSSDASRPDNRAGQLVLLMDLTSAMKQSADEIAADKYATIQDAESTLQQRLGAVSAKAMQTDAPASQPTTRPG